MIAIIKLQHIEFNWSIAEFLGESQGISNVQFEKTTNNISFKYATHNALEGLRETLKSMGYCFEFKY